MRLGTWNKPNTNEVRVYFNNITSRDVKVFAVQDGDRFTIKFTSGLYPSQQDEILDQIDRELEAMNSGERVNSWSDLLKLAH